MASDNERNSNNDRRPLNWLTDMTFEDKASGLSVRITRNDAYKPGFSVEVGREGKEGKEGRLIRHIPVRWFSHNGRASLDVNIAEAFAHIGNKVQEYLEGEVQKLEDERLDQQRKKGEKESKSKNQNVGTGLGGLTKADAAKKATVKA